MSNITYLVIGMVIGYIIGKRKGSPSVNSGLVRDQAEEKKRHLEKVMAYINGKHPSTSSGQESALITEQASEKKRNFEKVMEYFDQNRQATNDQIQQLLGVSDLPRQFRWYIPTY